MRSVRHCLNFIILFSLCFFGIIDDGWTAQKGGTVIYAQSGTVETLDPPGMSENTSEEINLMIYDRLFHFTPDLKMKGQLVEKYETSSDALTWTFWIRKGVRFHDGTDLDAEAIKLNFERWLGPEKPAKAYSLFSPVVKSVEVVDKYTIKLRLKTPFSPLPSYLSHPSAGIFSPAQFKKFGLDMSHNPCGSGPFKYKEWVKGDHLTLVRNEEYWDGPPYLDAIIVRPVTEPATRVMQIQAGQVHAVASIPPEVLPQLKKDPKLSVFTSPMNLSMFVIINHRKKPFDDLRVRQAMNYAVDKEAIARDLFQGLADPNSSVVAPIVEGSYQPRPYEYNPEKAKKLLAEAGYPNGFSCTLWTPSGRIPKDTEVSQLVQKYLGAVGITAKIQVWEWATYMKELRQPIDKAKWDILLMKFSPSTGEARWQLFLCWTSENFPPKGNNRAFYSNPAFDKLVELGTAALTPELKNKYFKEAQIMLRDDAAWIPICSPHSINVTSKKLHDFVFSPLEHAYATNKTWLEK